jgi:hypothetical protein
MRDLQRIACPSLRAIAAPPIAEARATLEQRPTQQNEGDAGPEVLKTTRAELHRTSSSPRQLSPPHTPIDNLYENSGQAKVAPTPIALQKLRSNPFSVVFDAHSKLPVAIADFDVYPRRTGVLKGVACGLTGDAVHLVPQDRAQISRLPLHQHTEVHRVLGILLGRKVSAPS